MSERTTSSETSPAAEATLVGKVPSNPLQARHVDAHSPLVTFFTNPAMNSGTVHDTSAEQGAQVRNPTGDSLSYHSGLDARGGATAAATEAEDMAASGAAGYGSFNMASSSNTVLGSFPNADAVDTPLEKNAQQKVQVPPSSSGPGAGVKPRASFKERYGRASPVVRALSSGSQSPIPRRTSNPCELDLNLELAVAAITASANGAEGASHNTSTKASPRGSEIIPEVDNINLKALIGAPRESGGSGAMSSPRIFAGRLSGRCSPVLDEDVRSRSRGSGTSPGSPTKPAPAAISLRTALRHRQMDRNLPVTIPPSTLKHRRNKGPVVLHRVLTKNALRDLTDSGTTFPKMPMLMNASCPQAIRPHPPSTAELDASDPVVLQCSYVGPQEGNMPENEHDQEEALQHYVADPATDTALEKVSANLTVQSYQVLSEEAEIYRYIIPEGEASMEDDQEWQSEDDGACSCPMSAIHMFDRGADYSKYKAHALFHHCIICHREPAIFLDLRTLSAVCPSHVKDFYDNSNKESFLYICSIDLTANYNRIFWCERCQRFTWKYTEIYDALIDQLAYTRETYWDHAIRDIHLHSYHIEFPVTDEPSALIDTLSQREAPETAPSTDHTTPQHERREAQESAFSNASSLYSNDLSHAHRPHNTTSTNSINISNSNSNNNKNGSNNDSHNDDNNGCNNTDTNKFHTAESHEATELAANIVSSASLSPVGSIKPLTLLQDSAPPGSTSPALPMSSNVTAVSSVKRRHVGRQHSTPSTDPPHLHLCSIAASTQGWRATQEDAETVFLVQLPVDNCAYKPDDKSTGSTIPVAVFCVFDGHGGDAVARLAAAYIENTMKQVIGQLPTSDLIRDPNNLDDVRPKMDSFFSEVMIKLDHLLRSSQEGLAGEYNCVGCTACIVAVTEWFVVCANLGDSGAAIYQHHSKELIPLSTPHRLLEESETARVIAAGHTVINDRIDGKLAVPRALGDYDFKQKNIGPDREAVSIIPSVVVRKCPQAFSRRWAGSADSDDKDCSEPATNANFSGLFLPSCATSAAQTPATRTISKKQNSDGHSNQMTPLCINQSGKSHFSQSAPPIGEKASHNNSFNSLNNSSTAGTNNVVLPPPANLLTPPRDATRPAALEWGLIIACDGVWDTMTYRQVGHIVSTYSTSTAARVMEGVDKQLIPAALPLSLVSIALRLFAQSVAPTNNDEGVGIDNVTMILVEPCPYRPE